MHSFDRHRHYKFLHGVINYTKMWCRPPLSNLPYLIRLKYSTDIVLIVLRVCSCDPPLYVGHCYCLPRECQIKIQGSYQQHWRSDLITAFTTKDNQNVEHFTVIIEVAGEVEESPSNVCFAVKKFRSPEPRFSGSLLSFIFNGLRAFSTPHCLHDKKSYSFFIYILNTNISILQRSVPYCYLGLKIICVLCLCVPWLRWMSLTMSPQNTKKQQQRCFVKPLALQSSSLTTRLPCRFKKLFLYLKNHYVQ